MAGPERGQKSGREGGEAHPGTILLSHAMSLFFERFGLRGVLGEVWTALYIEDRPLDERELRSRVGISTGAMSNALNELLDLGFAHRVGVPGERRFFYRAETEMWPLITRLMRERERTRLAEIVEALKSAAEKFDGAGGVAGAQRAEKTRHLLGIGTFALDVLDALTGRTKVEMLAAQKWLEMSGKLGGEPLTRLRRRINEAQLGRKR
jgi:HTH-type transcriptional regulator, glycine betaine synthesis regulator